jgi:FAD-NAD(P)-binding
MPPPARVAIVGAGPTASSLVERIAANLPELLGDRHVTVHLIDPYPAGLGRVWRPDLPHLLWMNSMAEDVTIFTDTSVHIAGPIRPGPTLLEWTHEADEATLDAVTTRDVAAEIRTVEPTTFPSRLVQSAYLEWFRRHVLATAPPNLDVVTHRARAVDVTEEQHGTQTVWLDGGEAEPLVVDAVVLALGHLDAGPRDGGATVAFAAAHDLVHVPAGHTADQDLSVLDPGADVIALGFGQAFTDLVALVTEGRGGRFETADDGHVTYHPSGAEPVLHVGSRRGVPYRAKLEYRLLGPPAPMPRFLDEAGLERLLAHPGQLQFRRDILPLVAREVGWAYYHELFVAHGERTSCGWEEFADRYSAASEDELTALIEATVPDPADRFSIASLDRPLAGLHFESADALHRHVAAHVVADVARRTDPTYSADLGAFLGLLWTMPTVGRIGVSGRVAPRSRVTELGAWWFSFFMYYASGPPPPRLRQLLALADAGLVHFIGAGTTVEADESRRRFVAHSTSHDGIVIARAYVDARIATASVSRTTDTMLARLHRRGDVTEEVVSDGDGWSANTGKVVIDHDLRLVRADGAADGRRFGVGMFTNRPAAGAFARPNTNAPAFRQHDALARTVLRTVAAVADERAARTVSP